MTKTKIVDSKIAHCNRVKSFRTSATLILTTLMLIVVAATTVATAQTYTDLYNFNYFRGRNPEGILAQGRDGNLYGTTPSGGSNGLGVVFRITPSGRLKVLYNFDGGSNGRGPWSGLTLGTDGNFYGTTDGTIFKITKNGTLTTLYSFAGGAALPIEGTDGNFYGTTGAGTAYKITTSGTFTLLAALPGSSEAPLLQATDGDFYGTTDGGGSNNCAGGCGTVFKMTPKGVVTIVYNFDGTHGEWPYAAVIQGSDGNFYGSTHDGGGYGDGVVFKLTPQGAITVLHNFPDPNYPNDGMFPDTGLVQATDGNFYGATDGGGTVEDLGVIFQITPAGAYSILYNFDGSQGDDPQPAPMQHTNGLIYGVAYYGGLHNQGVVYSLDLGLGPFVSLVSTTGKVGKTIEVLGQGFTGTTAVSFNGTPATYTVVSDTYLKTTVPTGATTGPVTVTTPGGPLISNKEFRVKP